jgi:hypothetical protein
MDDASPLDALQMGLRPCWWLTYLAVAAWTVRIAPVGDPDINHLTGPPSVLFPSHSSARVVRSLDPHCLLP